MKTFIFPLALAFAVAASGCSTAKKSSSRKTTPSQKTVTEAQLNDRADYLYKTGAAKTRPEALQMARDYYWPAKLQTESNKKTNLPKLEHKAPPPTTNNLGPN